jgi:hypothetical protein
MYNLWVRKWLSSNAYKSEFDYLWQPKYGKCTTLDYPSDYKLDWNKKLASNTTPNLTIIIPTYIKLAQMEP